MRWIVLALLLVHGVVHLVGFAKAFAYADLPQLTAPISRGMGLIWLAAGLLVSVTALMLTAWPRQAWIVGAVAVVVSQGVIVTAWRDAWAGTVGTALLCLVVSDGFLTRGPWSFRAEFDRDAAAWPARARAAPPVTESDIGRLPAPVRRYLRAAGAR